MNSIFKICVTLALLLMLTGTLSHAADDNINNGTDPTRLATTFLAQYKYSQLRRDDSVGLFEAQYTHPIGAAKHMSLGINVPFASGVIDSDYGLGDMSLKFTHVASLNRQRGLAYTMELIFDTAARNELGTGQTVIKASGFYAKFLKNGAIFAPALVEQLSLSDNDDRSRVNNTTLDLYYVPKLATPLYFVTFDPAVTVDWENEKEYASLTVTLGRMLGKVFGGDSQVYIKPQILGGDERPIDWSFQVGYKVIGF